MISHKGTAAIKTDRLLLRKILPDDAAAVFKWLGDPEVAKYERWDIHPDAGYTRSFIEHVYKYDTYHMYQWGLQYEDGLIGSVCAAGVSDYDQKAVVGYSMNREYWSKGFMTEAVKAVVRFMLAEVGLNRLEASHSVNNPASGRVLEKAGFALEGTAKDYYNSNSGLQDSRLFGITQGMYRKTNPDAFR